MTARPPGTAGEPCGITASNRVIFGQNASMGQFPWQAGLIYRKGPNQSLLCGGALIAPSYVLTAAHCVIPRDLRGWTLESVRLGALLADPRELESGARDVRVARALPHEQYRQNGARNVRNPNDIALVRLESPAPYTDLIRPVCLPEQNNGRGSSQQKKYIVAGWGYTEDLIFSPNLKFASVVSEDSENCGKQLQGVTISSDQLCARGENKEDSCNGDSGGPLIASSETSNSDTVFQVEGLVSFGKTNCLDGSPGAYTRVASYIDWIRQKMQE